MLTIQKNGMELKVSKGAFSSIYQNTGWAVVENTPQEAISEPQEPPRGDTGVDTTPPGEGGPEESQGEKDQEELLSDEEALEKMSMEELKQYASLVGVKKVKDLKDRDEVLEAISKQSR